MRGRKPLSSAAKEANGYFQKNPQRRNKHEPAAVPGKPAAPFIVASDELAFAKWNHLCEMLEKLGVLSQTDSDLMAMYCCAWSQWVELLAKVRKEGFVIKGAKGGMVSNPSARALRMVSDQLIKLSPEFGLSPSSRSRLNAMPKDAPDPFLDYMNELHQSRKDNSTDNN